MYTKNPVTGQNETLVNTSMLRGAVNGVTTKLADKADKGALEELSVYAEGLLPKDVYGTMVDAYVGLACKVADRDILEGAAKMAYAANPEKYAASNPSDNSCVRLTKDVYVEGNPIYDAVHAASNNVVNLPPLLRLQSTDTSLYSTGETLTIWSTELPNLTTGRSAFRGCIGFTSWDMELPNLTNGNSMFYRAGLTQWNIELPNLTAGPWMFGYCSGLTSFSVGLPAIHSAGNMFIGCKLDIDSLRCIAEGINDVSNLSVGTHSITIGLSTEASGNPLKETYKNLLNAKGWTVVF